MGTSELSCDIFAYPKISVLTQLGSHQRFQASTLRGPLKKLYFFCELKCGWKAQMHDFIQKRCTCVHVALNNGSQMRECACRGPRLRGGLRVKGEAGRQQAQLQVSGLISSLINNLSLGCRCRAGRAIWSRAFYVHFENKRNGCENWNGRVSPSGALW